MSGPSTCNFPGRDAIVSISRIHVICNIYIYTYTATHGFLFPYLFPSSNSLIYQSMLCYHIYMYVYPDTCIIIIYYIYILYIYTIYIHYIYIYYIWLICVYIYIINIFHWISPISNIHLRPSRNGKPWLNPPSYSSKNSWRGTIWLLTT